MAYQLCFFIGHFYHDGQFATLPKNGSVGVGRPAVKEPLNGGELRTSAISFCGGDADQVGSWDMKIEDDLIVFCEFRDKKAIAWILDVVLARNLDVIDGSNLTVVPLSELSQMATSVG